MGLRAWRRSSTFCHLGQRRIYFIYRFSRLNLMVTLEGIKADDWNYIRYRTSAANFIVTTRYWKFNRSHDLIKLPIGYTHVPYKIFNIGNMLLVGLFCEHDATAPRSATLLNPFFLKWVFYLWHDVFRFLRSVLRFATADWFNGAGINDKLIVQDCSLIPFFSK